MADTAFTEDQFQAGHVASRVVSSPLRSKLEATLTPKVSLAQQQNAVPLLCELALVNETEGALHGVEITLKCDPEFCAPKTWHIDQIGAGCRYNVHGTELDLNRAYLAGLREAVRGSVAIVAQSGDRELARFDHPIDVLAPDEWGGAGYLPELIAAHSCPNDPAIERILKKAAESLRQAGKDASLDGYQSGARNRVWNLISAIHNSIASFGIDYANPPASFDVTGQKIRSPGRILESGLGTCLDLVLLFTACLEQCGLNPLVLIKDGHAFAGCWLVDEDFSTAVTDDPQAISKRVKLGEMVVVETTLLTKRPAPPLSQALGPGLQHLDSEEEFICAIDVKRTRMQGIRPVMIGEAPEITVEPAPHGGIVQPFIIEDAPDLPDLEYIPEREENPKTPEGRVARWKRKLLDLTLRNNLLNYKPTKKTIPIYCPNPARLEDLLADGAKLKFVAMPQIMEGEDPRSAAIHQFQHGEDAKSLFAMEALERKDLLVNLPEGEIEGRLVNLFRQARNDLEEGGANTLYLAMGFLTWSQAEHAERKLKAPLLLLPVAIDRASVRSGFRLVLHDDDPRLNPTLLEMLRQDLGLTFPALEPELPCDDSGLDVPLIWQTIRKAIRDIKGWDLTDEVSISTFSFTKYLMWKDLEVRTTQLKENAIVRHLVDTPRDPFLEQGDFPEPSSLDDLREPKDTYCPLMADSSQLSAVFAAAEGKNFVLEGPPGTGKSQTITNMIVQCLAENKTVLFVSEKKAALDVVYRRLREVGLGTFCLELHSSKARKLEILNQLGEAWEAAGACDSDVWQIETERLARLRADLNEFPQRLHQEYRNGLTAYRALSHVIRNRNLPELDLSWPSADAHSESELQGLRDLCVRLGINAADVGGVADNVFSGIKHADWSPSWQRDFEKAAEELSGAIDRARPAVADFVDTLGLSITTLDYQVFGALIELSNLLPLAAPRNYGFAFSSDATDICNGLEKLAHHGRSWQEQRGKLSQPYGEEATTLDLEALTATWEAAAQTWWPRSLIMRRAVTTELRDTSDSGQRPSNENVATDLASLRAMQDEEMAISRLSKAGKSLGSDWRELESDWEQVAEAAIWGRRAMRVLADLAGSDLDRLVDLRAKLARLADQGKDLISDEGPIGIKAKVVSDVLAELNKNLGAIRLLVGADETETFVDGTASDWLTDLSSRVSKWRDDAPKLHGWCAWQKARSEAIAENLGPLVASLEGGEISPDDAATVFEGNYRRWWVEKVIEDEPVICNFVSAEHERQIDTFRDLDAQFMDLTKQYVRALLCANVPHKASVADKAKTEWGVLNRELNKKSRHMALRSLIGSLPNALTKLTPCLLMSPLSVAQYLNPEAPPFDVVIFDEASQIPVWDAIGAIARGRQAVIVGDPKQLPPTSFFGRNEEEEDDDLEVEDLESILDECMGANLPTRSLGWHYRSRHESLITFSNHHYYNGGLVTFPSTDTEDVAVRYHHVPDGVYEKGKATVNQAEARAVVAAVVEWLRDAEFNRDGLTLGVVTFNLKQQSLIEDLLDDERRRDPELERHFSADNIEPVFVKNLENVQGDERDIILFSITFGPDLTGRVSMNFGPLNNAGGERRLNVAVTRARQALHVYGTLKADQIDLSRTQAIGVRDFKHFLEFAERGPQAHAEAIDRPGGDSESGFEEEVADALSQRGWTALPQVGVSDFRIDLGIVHPDHPGRYLAGVECDGATYHRSATARDRDSLREFVLRGLGWEILRVWSTDWWIDPLGSADKIHAKLEALLEADRNKPDVPLNVSEATLETGVIEPSDEGALPSSLEDELRIPIPDPGERQPKISEPPKNVYLVADPQRVVESLDPEAFFEQSEYRNIASMIAVVVEIEGPIALDLVAERVARAYDFKRTGVRIQNHITEIALRTFQSTLEEERVFLWPKDVAPETYRDFRVTVTDQEPLRTAEQICLQELGNLARHVRDTDFPLDERELARGMAERLGYRRMAAKLEARLMAGIRAAG